MAAEDYSDWSEEQEFSWVSETSIENRLKHVYVKNRSLRVCIAAVTAFPENIAYVPDEHKAICEMIIKLRGE